jgi:hypothetical protein
MQNKIGEARIILAGLKTMWRGERERGKGGGVQRQKGRGGGERERGVRVEGCRDRRVGVVEREKEG